MKTFGKILFSIMIIFLGLQIYSFVSSLSTNKSIGKQGDKAFLEEDVTFFNSIFEYYKEDVVFEDSNDDFKLRIFNVGTKDNNLLIFLAEGIKQEDSNKVLKLYLKLKSGKEVEQHLIAAGNEDWYLQWLYLEGLYENQLVFDEIHEIKISFSDDQLIYEKQGNPILSVKDYDITSYLNNKNVLHAIVNKVGSVNEIDFNEEIGETVEYDLSVKVLLNEDLNKDDVYLIGNFNNFDINDKSFKLTNKKDTFLYEGSFEDLKIIGDEIQYSIVINGEIEVDNDDNPIIYSKKLTNDSDLSLFNIYKTETRVRLNDYNWIKWVGMLGYFLVMGVLTYLIYFRKKPVRASYNNKAVKDADVQVINKTKTENANMNLKKLEETVERDENLNIKKEENEQAK